MKKILAIVRKELLQVGRDKLMLRVIFVVPLVQLLILGYAITTDIRHIRLLACDLDRTMLSRDILSRFMHNEYFDVIPGGEMGHNEALLFKSYASMALTIPKDFQQKLVKGETPEIGILLDGQNSNTAAVGLGYCNKILLEFARQTLKKQALKNPALKRQVFFATPRTRIYYNPELKSVYFMIPGIISILLSVITMLLTALAIVKENESGTLDQLIVTPLKPLEIIIGKTIPFALLGFIEMCFAMVFGVVWFGIPISGSIPVLLILSLSYILTSLGLGIFISTLVDTQQQALFIAWFFLVTFILLSGFFYPIDNMPPFVRALTLLDPLRYFITILRELFLKGNGFAELWREFLSLIAIGLSVFTLASLRFHKRHA